MVAGDGFHDEGNQPSERGRGDDGAHGPQEELAANDEAAQVHVLLLLLSLVPRPGEQPALLGLVQLPGRHRQRRTIQIQVAAPIVISDGVRVDLQRPAPGIPPIHTHPSTVSSVAVLPPLKMRPFSTPYPPRLLPGRDHHKLRSGEVTKNRSNAKAS
ncbi:hypothetical protein MUK42_25354 [Musa troglodytarum]|uniref:Uncharacterized protein n=1 Tax=Musa troglodytarum TaxID=320322 RepID=A0A9E7HEF1_9LILI|nr:hypothetical protein MUK42_25354 [Musa troglodytarum]